MHIKSSTSLSRASIVQQRKIVTKGNPKAIKMDSGKQSAADRVVEDIEPSFEWTRDEGNATLMVILPGFRKDDLKVHLTSVPTLRINAERQITNKLVRVQKEFSIPTDCDSSEVSARFESGILYVKFPIVITTEKPSETTTTPPQEAPKQPQPVAAPAVAPTQKERSEDRAEAKTQQKEKEPISDEMVAKNKVKTEETTATSKRDQEKQEAKKALGKSKTRLLDFSASLRESDKDYKETFVGLIMALKKTKKLANFMVLILLVVVLGLYVKHALRKLSLGGSKFHEL